MAPAAPLIQSSTICESVQLSFAQARLRHHLRHVDLVFLFLAKSSDGLLHVVLAIEPAAQVVGHQGLDYCGCPTNQQLAVEAFVHLLRRVES